MIQTDLLYDKIISIIRFSEGEMNKKKKVAALKHRRRLKKLEEKRKAQAPEKAPEKKLKEKSKAQAPETPAAPAEEQ